MLRLLSVAVLVTTAEAFTYMNVTTVCAGMLVSAEQHMAMDSMSDADCTASTGTIQQAIADVIGNLSTQAASLPDSTPTFVKATMLNTASALDTAVFDQVYDCSTLASAMEQTCLAVYPAIEPVLPIMFGLMSFGFATCMAMIVCCCCCYCFCRSMMDAICCCRMCCRAMPKGGAVAPAAVAAGRKIAPDGPSVLVMR